MAFTMVGSSSVRPQIHQFQIQRRSTTTTTTTTTTKTTTKLVLVVAEKSEGGANTNKNKGSNNTSFKAGGKFDSKNRKTTSTTTLKQDREYNDNNNNNEQLLNGFQKETINDGTISGVVVTEKDIEIEAKLRELPGLEKDFWEGPEWDTFGFIVQYLWAFGIIFALVACGVAVATYNEGAADFKQTPAYKESIQSREFLEEPESSNSDIFESNPTEEAPALE